MRSIVLATLLVGCHPATTTPATTSPENVAPARLTFGYVLVSDGAWLRSAPRADADGARGQVLKGAPTDDANIEGVWVARLIADEGEWVEIENLTYEEASPHCYGSIGALGSFKLRLHVRRADLVPVTKAEVVAYFDDESQLDLAAGVAMGPEGERFRVGVDDLHPVLPIDPEAVGMSYVTPTSHFDSQVEAEDLVDVPPGGFVVDGQELDLPDAYRDAATIEEGPDATHQLVTVAMPCSRYHGLVEKQEYGGVGWGERAETWNTIGSGSYDRPTVKAGAALTWPDGTPAGETLEQIDAIWNKEHGDRVCFEVPMLGKSVRPEEETGEEDWFLTLCAAKGDWQGGFGA